MEVQDVVQETMENKITKIFFLTCIVSVLQVRHIKAQIEPDTSICGKIFLLNAGSVKREMGDVMSKLNQKEDLPDIYFSSKNKKQYLKLIFHPGSYKNSFSMFEIGYISPKMKIKNILKYNNFHTERNIKLGMAKKEFLLIIGKKLKINNLDNSYLFRLDEPNNPFLEMYGLPIYEAKYYFKNNVLVKFYFGFEYP